MWAPECRTGATSAGDLTGADDAARPRSSVGRSREPSLSLDERKGYDLAVHLATVDVPNRTHFPDANRQNV